MRSQSLRLALIGYGAIAGEIIRNVELNPALTICGALVLPRETERASPFPLTTQFRDLVAWRPDIIVECASHEAVAAYVPQALTAGIDVMIISIGALADETLLSAVRGAARASTAQVFLPSGAILGLDGLGAAGRAGLDWVRLTSRKPPLSWAGAPGVAGVDLGAIQSETVIFSGTAREAARLFPKNANVAATTALAGLGFDKTEVRLIADPHTERNSHVLEFEGRAGRFRVETAGLPSPDNPKTSMLTAYNILRIIEQKVSPIVL